jgi:hypothetical protein
MPSPRELIFVYNVDGTPAALLGDFIHRITSPETYPCNLCDLTFGRFIKKSEWTKFVATLSIPSTFLLRNIFVKKFPDHADATLPAVFLATGGKKLVEFLSTEELNAVKSLDALKELVSKKVSALS